MSSTKSLTGSVIPVDSTITDSTGVQLTVADRDSISPTCTDKRRKIRFKFLFYLDKQTLHKYFLPRKKKKTKKQNKLNSHYYFNYYFMTSCNRPEGHRVRLFVPPSLLDRFSYWLPPFAGGDDGLDRLQANQFPAFHSDCDLSAYECCCCLFCLFFFQIFFCVKNN
jgi:hypothetical protein